MKTTCPHCGKNNPLADAEGYTDEAPREYHADCWRAVQETAKICRVCAAGHRITDEMIAENAHLGGDLRVSDCIATGDDGLCDECRAQI